MNTEQSRPAEWTRLGDLTSTSTWLTPFLCSTNCNISSRERRAQIRTEPSSPPLKTYDRLASEWVATVVTAPRCALGISQSACMVLASWHRTK